MKKNINVIVDVIQIAKRIFLMVYDKRWWMVIVLCTMLNVLIITIIYNNELSMNKMKIFSWTAKKKILLELNYK